MYPSISQFFLSIVEKNHLAISIYKHFAGKICKIPTASSKTHSMELIFSHHKISIDIETLPDVDKNELFVMEFQWKYFYVYMNINNSVLVFKMLYFS